MSNDPIPEKFSDMPPMDARMTSGEGPSRAELEALVDGSPQVYLRDQDNGKYLQISTSEYCIQCDKQEDATKFIIAEYADPNLGQVHYIVIADGTKKAWYLSYSMRSYMGAYSWWLNARYWSVDPIDSMHFPGIYPYVSGTTSYYCVNGLSSASKIDSVVTVVPI